MDWVPVYQLWWTFPVWIPAVIGRVLSAILHVAGVAAVLVFACDVVGTRANAQNYRETWALQYFSPATTFDDLADPDGDGLVNLLEYAFGFSPLASNPPGAGVTVSTAVSGANVVLTATFRRDPRATDLSYFLETSSDASTWTTIVESDSGGTPSGPTFVSEADAPGEAPVKMVVASEVLPAGSGLLVRVRVVTPPKPTPTLIFQQTGGITNGFTVPGVPLDLTANRYLIEFDGATWANLSYGTAGIQSPDGVASLAVRFDGGTGSLYESDNSNSTDWSSNGQGSVNLWTGVANTPYSIAIECGLGQAHVVLNGVPITMRPTGPVNAINRYRRFATTSARPDPANLARVSSTGVSLTGMRIYRREWNTIHNLVLLGDSITAMASAEAWDNRLRSDLGVSWLIYNQGVGYRQSRELVNAIATPFPGDSANNPNYYPDVAGLYRAGELSNWVIIGIGTNDIININRAYAAPPNNQCGGYTATGTGDGVTANTDTINNVLAAIAAIRADNPGWKVAVRTVLNTNGMAAGGSYAACEGARQAINASIRSGAVHNAADMTIDLENLFCPQASRTDGVPADGILYNPAYWPPSAQTTGYSNNPAYFDAGHVHPVNVYPQIADYVASMF